MEIYQSIFFVATVTWVVLIAYIAYLHRRMADLEKKIKRLK